MRFVFEVAVEVERTEGKFASRDEIGDVILDALESADPGSYEGDEGGQYEGVEWSVEDVSEAHAAIEKKRRDAARRARKAAQP